MLAALVACSEKQEGVAPVELTFDVKHSETNSTYEVHTSVLITGENNTAPTDILQSTKQTIINSLSHSIGVFFTTYPEGVNSKDAEYLGFNACESAIRQMPVVKTCKVTSLSWKKK